LKRLKRRYLMVQVEGEIIPSEREFIDAVWATIAKLYGDVGASSSGLSLISFDSKRGIGVMRVWLSAVPVVRASIATVTNIVGKQATINVLCISGTIKSLWNNEKSF
jgi:ribonuclease P/MRP protein subunit POP5